MSKIVIAFLVVVIIAGFAIVLTGVNSPTGAFGVDDSLVANPIYLIGSLTLDPDFLEFLQEDKSLLFGPPDVCIPKNNAVRSDFFEVNGILDCPGPADDETPAGCTFDAGQCEIVTTLKAEILANQPTTEKERNLVLKIIGDQASPGNLEEVMDCLIDAYSQQSLDVGSDTYFNIIKNCYVRAIKDLGILEQTYIDEPEAFFFVQKLQAIEVDLQHMLAIEDQKAKMAPIVPVPSPTPTPVPSNCEDLNPPLFNNPCLGVFDGSCDISCVPGPNGQQPNCGLDTTTGNCGLTQGTCSDNGASCTSVNLALCANPFTATCNSSQPIGCCQTVCLTDAQCTAVGATCCNNPNQCTQFNGYFFCTVAGGPVNCCTT